MNENKIYIEVKKMIKSKFGKDVTLETILDETGIDSLDLLDLIVEVEKKNNVSITDDELLEIKTISDVVNIISSKIK